ncbi:MAG: 2-hydroxyacyl-CoA dehydratase subunit D [Candidatus Thorarchaeota archaeon]
MLDREFLADFFDFLNERKETGGKIVAFIAHDNIPEELLDAFGCFPLRMMFAGNDELMDASHDFLPPSTCAFTQSCIGLFSTKQQEYPILELVDYFILSNHCVSDICGSEIISKFFNVPRINFYLPYTKNDNSIKYFKLELMDLKKQLEAKTSINLNPEILMNSIKKYNKFKIKIRELNELKILGSKKVEILQKAILYGPSFYNELSQFIDTNKDKQEINLGKKDVILTGCSVFINDSLVDIIEEGGGNVLFFDTWIGNHYSSQIFEEKLLDTIKDPYELLVERFKRNILSDHSVPHFLDNKVSQIVKLNSDYKKSKGKSIGVINHILKFCDHFSMLSTYFKENLQKHGIQVLNLERDYSRANKGQISTRIEAFLEMIA